jgi:hypothetical protein
VHRDFERDDPRRRYRADDDPRDDPRERYGNEEDRWSREYRRAYAESHLPSRLHDDRPYDQRGYEPESGRPGGRENVDLDPPRGPAGRRAPFERNGWDWQRGYDGQGRRWTGDPFGRFSPSYSRPYTRPYSRSHPESYPDPYASPDASPYASPYDRGSPYDQGEVGSWYGGDTGMGDPGSSQLDQPRQTGRFGERDRGALLGRPGGDFSGRGPRGYRRSDERIRDDVCELLTRHPEIDASSMDVDVHDGTVILRGTADSGRTRRLTEALVEDVPGVRDVENELRVSRRPYHEAFGYETPGPDAMVDTRTFVEDRGGLRESGTPASGIGVAGTAGVSRRSGPGEPGSGAGGGPSQHGNRWQIRETMDAVGSDGELIGSVKAVRGTDFLVDRPRERDLYVPFSAVKTVDGERVMLSCRADEVDDQDWPASGPIGSHDAPPAR